MLTTLQNIIELFMQTIDRYGKVMTKIHISTKESIRQPLFIQHLCNLTCSFD